MTDGDDERRLTGPAAEDLGVLRATLSGLRDAVVVVDRDGRPLLANAPARKLPVATLLAAELRLAFATGDAVRDVALRVPNGPGGPARFVEADVTPLHRAEGEPWAALVVARDTTARQWAASELAVRKRMLEAVVDSASWDQALLRMPAVIGEFAEADGIVYWTLDPAAGPIVAGRWSRRDIDARSFRVVVEGPAQTQAVAVAGGVPPAGMAPDRMLAAAVVRSGPDAVGLLQAVGLTHVLDPGATALLRAAAHELGRLLPARRSAHAGGSRRFVRGGDRDPVTGLMTRAAVDAELRGRALPGRPPFAVALLQLDGVAPYSIGFGATAGQGVLVEVAAAWSATLRTHDLLARWSEDEFLAVLAGSDLATAERVAARLVERVPHPLGAHAGIAVWDGHRDVPALIVAADCALFEARATARPVVGAPLVTVPMAADG